MESINFCLENISEVRQLPLYDAELLSIVCDYRSYAVYIYLKLDSPSKSNVKARISLFGVKLLNVPINEPWGAGIYINEVTCDTKEAQIEDSLFNLKVLLNSGDEILVIAKDLIYFEELNMV